MRWVDLFVIDTFLASGQRVPDVDQRVAQDQDDLPLAVGTERTQRFDDRFDELGDPDDDDGDEWDAETLDEIPEDLEIPADDAFGRDAAIPPALLRRVS